MAKDMQEMTHDTENKHNRKDSILTCNECGLKLEVLDPAQCPDLRNIICCGEHMINIP